MTKSEHSRALRYKRPALASLGYEAIYSELDRIREACEEVRWYLDEDDDQLLDALDGDDEAVWEFKTAFADLTAKTEGILEAVDRVERDCFSTSEEFARLFDDCTVALIGNRYEVVGYDSMEDENSAVTGQLQAVEDAYCKAEAVGFAAGFAETRTFERLLDALPAAAWIG
ncbi:hypothetical protein D7X33_08560 [Butyricicoccus sp. 1XD8-22]|nr:hypothetical protein D7X33_08560 [Butyricicoccus sp. 1XD8-22]